MNKGFFTGLVALVLGCAPKQQVLVGDYLRLEEQPPIQAPESLKITSGMPAKYVPESIADTRTVRVPYVAQQPTERTDIAALPPPPSYKDAGTMQKYTLARDEMRDDLYNDFRNEKVLIPGYLLMPGDGMK